MESKNIIEKLELLPHPEGGYYKEIYRSETEISITRKDKSAKRSLSTSIYYMLEKNDFSAFHKLESDELWYFHSGSNIVLHIIDTNGNYLQKEIGMSGNAVPQFVIKAGNWFAAEVSDKNGYSLLGCMVSPGFDFEDFDMAERSRLLELFPQHQDIIKKFTRV